MEMDRYMMKEMNLSEYGEVLNGPLTYKFIAEALKFNGSILIGWTDDVYTHFDILFKYRTVFAGTNIQGGIRSNDLFISIMRKGSFGFEVNGQKKSSGYIAEKLNLNNSVTTEKLAELINGVINILEESK